MASRKDESEGSPDKDYLCSTTLQQILVLSLYQFDCCAKLIYLERLFASENTNTCMHCYKLTHLYASNYKKIKSPFISKEKRTPYNHSILKNLENTNELQLRETYQLETTLDKILSPVQHKNTIRLNYRRDSVHLLRFIIHYDA